MKVVTYTVTLIAGLSLCPGCRPVSTPKSAPTTSLTGKTSNWKTVTSRDGLVTFRVPASWVAKHVPEGPSVFQEDRPDAPRLLVTMLAMKLSEPIDPNSPNEVLRSYAVDAKLPDGENLPIEQLADGNVLVRVNKLGEDQGNPAFIHGWIIANPLPPRHVRLFFFTFRAPLEQVDKPLLKEQVQRLDREIRASEYAEQLAK